MRKGKKLTRKILAWLLVFVMVFSLAPVTAFAEKNPHSHDILTFSSGVGQGVKGSGSYYLVHDEKVVQPSAGIVIHAGAVVNICLNGHTLDLNGTQILVAAKANESYEGVEPASATLNIYDCAGGGGKIINGKGSQYGNSRKGGAIYVRGSTVNIYGGTIENNDAAWGGAIFIDGSYKNDAGESFPATVNMYGGTIQNNTATYGGGAIEIENDLSTFNMYGGSIINNKVTNTTTAKESNKNYNVHKGGGVHFASGTMTVQGKVNITGNTVAGVENNVYVRNGKTITVNGLEGGSRIGVSAYASQTNVSDPTIVTDGYGTNVSSDTEKDIRYFFMDRTHDTKKYALEHNGTELQIKEHKHNLAYCSNGNKNEDTWGDISVDANQIKAKCIDEERYCAFHPNILTLSLQADDAYYTGSPYAGIHYDGEEEKIWNYAGIDMPEITYTGVDGTEYGPSTTAPIDVGRYKATMKVTSGEQEYTAESETFEIKKVDSVCTAPTEKTELIYDGSAQALVNEGSTLDELSRSTGTMYYKLGDSGEWTTAVPTATNAGEYTVYYYVVSAH